MHADTDSPGRWEAFQAEAMPHVDRLFRHAMWLERNRAEAEDLVQETLVQALQSFHRYTRGTNCPPWLGSILPPVRLNRQGPRGRLVCDRNLGQRASNIVPFWPRTPQCRPPNVKC